MFNTILKKSLKCIVFIIIFIAIINIIPEDFFSRFATNNFDLGDGERAGDNATLIVLLIESTISIIATSIIFLIANKIIKKRLKSV